jgi:hypothetical protein
MSKTSRRAILASIAAAPAVAVPGFAIAAEPDPIFAAIEAHRAAAAQPTIGPLRLRGSTSWRVRERVRRYQRPHCAGSWDEHSRSAGLGAVGP